MDNILFWCILSSLVTLLILSIIRDIVHYVKLAIKQIDYKYNIGERVVLKLPSKFENNEKLIVGEITNQVYNPNIKEPVYSVKAKLNRREEINLFVKENRIISTEAEIIRFKRISE